MDLGIRGRKAIVCAASKGLGRACAFSLAVSVGSSVPLYANGHSYWSECESVAVMIFRQNVRSTPSLVFASM